MAQPELKDGDGGPDDGPEIDFIPDSAPQFYWAASPDEIRRSFIFDRVADISVHPHVMIENMEIMFRWLKGGEVPKPPKKSHLKAVAES